MALSSGGEISGCWRGVCAAAAARRLLRRLLEEMIPGADDCLSISPITRVRLTTLNINIVVAGRIRIIAKTGKTVKAFE